MDVNVVETLTGQRKKKVYTVSATKLQKMFDIL